MKKLIIALVILTLFLAACEGQDGTPTGEKDLPFIGGTTGLLVSFVQDAPPAEVYDGGDFPFDIELRLMNDGERTIEQEDVIVEVTGIDPVEFAKTPGDFTKMPDENLLGKAKDTEGNILESNPVFVTFADLNHEQQVTGNLRYPIFASVCYRYGTDAVGRICIKEDPYQTGGPCEVKGEKDMISSGAPVQVSGLQEVIAGTNKIKILFTVEHKGNGRVFLPDTECNKDDGRGIENKVLVSVDTGIDGLECERLRDGTETSGTITLTDGSATVSCTQPVTSPGTYLKTVDITVDYDYQEVISTSLLLIHEE
jgi:hypothetical protein